MKNFFKFGCLCLMFISCSLFFTGCLQNEFTTNFIRFDIQEREKSNDYCLDFVIEFDNKSSKDKTISKSDFYIEINNKQNEDVVFLYEYEDVFILGHYTAKNNEKNKIRVRVVDNINMGERNKILVKYKEQELVNDNVYFSTTKKQGQ